MNNFHDEFLVKDIERHVKQKSKKIQNLCIISTKHII